MLGEVISPFIGQDKSVQPASGHQWMISVSKGARILFGIWTGFLDSPGINIGR